MAISYSVAVKQAQHQTTISAIDARTLPGRILLLDSSQNTLATLTLSKPCGVISTSGSNVSLVFTTPLQSLASGTGDVVTATIQDGSGIAVASNISVGGPGSGADIVMSSVRIVTGTNVQISALSIRH